VATNVGPQTSALSLAHLNNYYCAAPVTSIIEAITCPDANGLNWHNLGYGYQTVQASDYSNYDLFQGPPGSPNQGVYTGCWKARVRAPNVSSSVEFQGYLWED
jgi:hypothetical protein